MNAKNYITKAIQDKRSITIKYRKYDGSVSTRKLSDIDFSDEYGDRYIKAFCHLRNENRTFKISRIIEIDGVSTNNSVSSYTSSSSNGYGKKEGCYIATMAYGNYNHPQVMILREYRDHVLSSSIIGRHFIRLYYYISPRLVFILQGHNSTNHYIRLLLDRLIRIIKKRYSL